MAKAVVTKEEEEEKQIGPEGQSMKERLCKMQLII